MRIYSAYAGPSAWGPWITIGSHIGVADFKITANPVGATLLKCRVRYYQTSITQVIEEWIDSVFITCGNCVASVEVSFMGIPTGSAVDGTVNP
jgi:hypothetical protein